MRQEMVDRGFQPNDIEAPKSAEAQKPPEDKDTSGEEKPPEKPPEDKEPSPAPSSPKDSKEAYSSTGDGTPTKPRFSTRVASSVFGRSKAQSSSML